MGVFRVLLLLGLLVKVWWLILAALVCRGRCLSGWWSCKQIDDADERERREHAALVARADQQQWVLAGNDRGIYGDDPPNQIN